MLNLLLTTSSIFRPYHHLSQKYIGIDSGPSRR